MIKLVLIGSGGFAKEVLMYLNDIPETKVIGYIDKLEKKDIDSFVPYLGDDNAKFSSDIFFVLSIGSLEIRKRMVDLYGEDRFYTLIHPSARISNSAKIGQGSIICPNCYIGPDAEIGKFCLMNYHTFVPHNCKLGKFSFLAPLTNIGGDTKIGNNFFAGLSVTIIPRVKIGNNVNISAGSVVTRNIEDGVTVFGNPARKMNEKKIQED